MLTANMRFLARRATDSFGRQSDDTKNARRLDCATGLCESTTSSVQMATVQMREKSPMKQLTIIHNAVSSEVFAVNVNSMLGIAITPSHHFGSSWPR